MRSLPAPVDKDLEILLFILFTALSLPSFVVGFSLAHDTQTKCAHTHSQTAIFFFCYTNLQLIQGPRATQSRTLFLSNILILEYLASIETVICVLQYKVLNLYKHITYS